MDSIAIAWILLILLPIHGMFFLGRRWERERTRRIIREYWSKQTRNRKN